MSPFDLPRFSVWFAAAVSLFTLLLWCVMPSDTLVHLVEEGQLVENLTLVFYAVTIALLIVLPIPHFTRKTRWAIIIALLAMMAREADLHKYIDHISMLKLRFWTGSLPGLDKVYAFLSLAPIIVACLYLVIRFTGPLWQGIKAGKNYAVTVTTFICLIFLTNGIDRSLGIIKEMLGWHAPEWLVALQTSQEEFLELALPCLALVAVLQYRRQMVSSLAILERRRVGQ